MTKWPKDETTGSVGSFLPNIDSKLVDDEGNDISGFDVRGELCVRGPLVFKGYFGNPEATARDFDQDGYFHTGDIACKLSSVLERLLMLKWRPDRDGKSKLWYIVDRKKVAAISHWMIMKSR